MTPAARTQAAIELVDAIIDAARKGGAAADTLVQRYFATRRYAGSKDRRAVRELVFAAIRACGPVPPSGRAALLRLADTDFAVAATFDGSAHGPAPIDPAEPRAEGGLAPAWLEARLAASDVAGRGLLTRAPLDLRINPARADLAAIQAVLPEAEPIAGTRHGVRVPAGTRVEALPIWQAGGVEVQDAGSQLVADAVAARAGEAVIDLCAGGGGKTLAMAADMGADGEGEGALLAADTDRARLSQLAPRALRAGVTVETRLLNPGREADALADVHARADAVLVDAPCSGTGTWRRNPEARWRLTPARLDRLVATQAHILDLAASLVRPGGRLIHVVCSLLDEEGAGQVDAFLARHPGWTAEPLDLPLGRARKGGWRLDPASDGTDGFFLARLRAPC
jgi:16S rRNA (cytosine967-C5)-methyltransferase